MAKFMPAENQPRYAKVLLLGNAGKGKTRCLLSFPKPVVVDSEGGTGWFADKFKFQVAHTKSVNEMKSLLDDIQRGQVPCETICIDSLTSFHNTLLSAGGKKTQDGSLSMREWGVLKKEERLLMDRLYLLPFHVVCTAWVKDEYAKPGDVINGQKVTPNELIKIGETIDFDKKAMHAFDFIFKMETDQQNRFFATCLKARGDRFKTGQTLPNLSWEALAPLFTGSGDAMAGQSEDDASDSDVELFSGASDWARSATKAKPAAEPSKESRGSSEANVAPITVEVQRTPITFKARASLNALVGDAKLTPLEIAEAVGECLRDGRTNFEQLETEEEARIVYKALLQAKERATSEIPL